MFLKKVYISGFKSFAKPTQLTFDNNINAIVGPNGSGKSNISDAIRFVLGEQRTTQMRSQKLEDIIFSGTDAERARGAAEVRLVLDRGDEGDLEITRKLYRTGESVFLINGRKVRLKDIQKLFYDTGLGKNGYSIVSQGGVDKIVTSNPQILRELVEEAVGIAGFKAKRIETEKHLEATRDNIDRVKDILDELEHQLKPLKSRAEKARRYLEINEILKSIDLVSFYYKELSYRESLEKIDKSIGNCEFNILDIEKKCEKLDSLYLKTKEQSKKIREEVQTLQYELEKKRKEEIDLRECKVRSETILEREELELKTTKTNIKRLNTEIERLNREKHDFCSLLESNRREIQEENTSNKNLKRKLSKLEEMISEKEAQRRESESKRILEFNKSLELNNELVNLKTEYSKIQERLTRLDKDKSNFERKKEELEQKKKRLNDKLQELDKCENKIDDYSKRLELLTKKRDEALTYRETQKANLTNMLERINYLRDLLDSHRGYNKAVREVIEHSRNDSKVYGVLGDLFRVESSYALAISTVLSSRAQNIIVKDETTASRLIEYLKNAQIGRVTFLPVKSMRVNPLSNQILDQMKKVDGFIAVANTLIQTEKSIKSVFDSILSHTIVIKDFTAASNFRKQFPRNTIVTLEGEIFYPGGAIVGGKTKRDTRTPIFYNLEIERCQDQVKEINSNIKKGEDSFQRTLREIESIQEQIKNYSKNKNSLIESINAIKTECAFLEDEVLTTKASLDSNSNYYTLKKEVERKIDAIEDQLSLIQIDKLESTQEDYQDEITLLRERVNQSNIKLSSINQKIESTKERISDIEKMILLRQDELDVDKNSKEKKKAQIQSKKIELDKLNTNLENVKTTIEDFERSLNQKSDEQNNCINRQNELEEKIKDLNKEQLSEIETKNKFERERETNTNKIEILREKIKETYQLSFSQIDLKIEFLEENMLDLEEKEILALRKELKGLGPIYPEAIQEYQKLSKRYKQLKRQYDDLINAEENILETIDTLNQSMTKQFRDRFKILNDKFSSIFHSLFEGGTAHMDYIDPDNILESGIELSAQPPGKSLKSLNLLSGGEKAMTAIALLLSFIELNPTPFSILDEIDAALDDNNILRFTNYLKNMKGNNQFIIITHRKHTLEVCDCINGITMSKDGVSRLLKLKVSDYLN